jgi:hypothetical protein
MVKNMRNVFPNTDCRFFQIYDRSIVLAHTKHIAV